MRYDDAAVAQRYGRSEVVPYPLGPVDLDGIRNVAGPDTTKTTSNRRRKRARPTSLSQSTTSSLLSPTLDEDTATEEEITDVYDNMLTDVHTNETVNTPVHITTDDVYMYSCTPEGRGNSSPTREPDGIG